MPERASINGRQRYRLGPLRRMGIGRQDATLFVAAFALWAATNGVSLILTNNAFTRQPAYVVALNLGLNDDYVGVSMVLNAFLLLYAISMAGHIARSLIILLTGVAWSFWSVILGLGSYVNHIVSANAMWSVVASLLLMSCTAPHHWHERYQQLPSRPDG